MLELTKSEMINRIKDERLTWGESQAKYIQWCEEVEGNRMELAAERDVLRLRREAEEVLHAD